MNGKVRPDIKYYTECNNGMRMYFFNDKISYVFAKYDTSQVNAMPSPTWRGLPRQQTRRETEIKSLYRMDMSLLDAAPVSIERVGESSDYTNYYYAHCPDGVLNVRSYSSITYKNIYPNIDLVYYQTPKGLEYNFVVNPGGNVADIQLRYDGVSDVAVTPDGKINATNPLGKIEVRAPYTYQSIAANSNPAFLDLYGTHNDGAVQPIATSYRLCGNVLSFDVKDYDHTQPLVIDPTLLWCTFYGGSTNEVGIDVCVADNR